MTPPHTLSQYTLSLGSKARDFDLMGSDMQRYCLDNFKDMRGLVIFFTCNHCPYVIGSDESTRRTAMKYQSQEIAFIGINSNSPNTYPEDSFEQMRLRMDQHKFPWHYLHDSTQEVARAYGALKTPHFFLFDRNRLLIYCGRAVDNPREAETSPVHHLEDALEDFIAGRPIARPLTNPIGCNIKWEGKPAHWMPPQACDLISES